MFDNVLVGVDGQLHGRDAIALATRLVGPDGRLTLAHVHPGKLRSQSRFAPAHVEAEQRDSDLLLAHERATAGVEGELASVVGLSPGRALHQQAEERHVDLLVVGSCSHGPVGRVMLGDDTREALNGAPCAVAVAPTGYAEDPTPLSKIGVGYDGSPESTAALALAKELAAAAGAVVHAIEVVAFPSICYTGLMPPAIGESIDLMLAEASARMNKLPDVEGHAVYGLPKEELAIFGDQVDLLIVGSRSYGPVKRLVLGSTANHLERRARCPLLVLPRVAIHTPERQGRPNVTVAA